MSAEISLFEKNGKSYPVLKLMREGEKNKFAGITFGLNKANLILDHIDAIRDFVNGAPVVKETRTDPIESEQAPDLDL